MIATTSISIPTSESNDSSTFSSPSFDSESSSSASSLTASPQPIHPENEQPSNLPESVIQIDLSPPTDSLDLTPEVSPVIEPRALDVVSSPYSGFPYNPRSPTLMPSAPQENEDLPSFPQLPPSPVLGPPPLPPVEHSETTPTSLSLDLPPPPPPSPSSPVSADPAGQVVVIDCTPPCTTPTAPPEVTGDSMSNSTAPAIIPAPDTVTPIDSPLIVYQHLSPCLMSPCEITPPLGPRPPPVHVEEEISGNAGTPKLLSPIQYEEWVPRTTDSGRVYYVRKVIPKISWSI